MFGDKLKDARKKAGMTQAQLADIIGTTNTTISNWEKNVSKPDIDTVELICGALHISPNYLFKLEKNEPSARERRYAEMYYLLDPHGKKIVETLIDLESERIETDKVQREQAATLEIASIPIHLATYYQKMASAGKGEYLMDDMCESKIAIRDTELARQSDFAIGINGDSMEPLYYDGDIALVQAKQTIEIGEIGIFILNKESYIKKAGEEGLVSLNPSYPVITIEESDDLRCVGKVLGKAEIITA